MVSPCPFCTRKPHIRTDSRPFTVINLVVLEDGSIWSCDVGFGGDGPTSPLALSANPNQEPEAVTNLGSQDVRLRRGVFPETVREEANQVWFYEYRNGKASAWNTYYAFGESEASHWDLQCANFWVVTHPDSFQRKQILSVKFIRGGIGGTETSLEKGRNGEAPGEVAVVGKIMLADDVIKRNMGGKTETLKHCGTELERTKALEVYFGIYLTEEEKQGIEGFETELK